MWASRALATRTADSVRRACRRLDSAHRARPMALGTPYSGRTSGAPLPSAICRTARRSTGGESWASCLLVDLGSNWTAIVRLDLPGNGVHVTENKNAVAIRAPPCEATRLRDRDRDGLAY